MSPQTLQGVWWKKVDASEKVWIGIALLWCLIVFAMMPLGHLKGGQNPSFETYRTAADPYMAKVDAFVEAGPKVGEDKGMDLVHGFSLFPLNLNFMVPPGYE
jgi:hypothetical protein